MLAKQIVRRKPPGVKRPASNKKSFHTLHYTLLAVIVGLIAILLFNSNPRIEDVVKPLTQSMVVEMESSAQALLKTHSQVNQTDRVFHGGSETLAYLTPWNRQGFKLALEFPQKFTLLSPVWFRVSRKSSGIYTVDGQQDVDMEWLDSIRKSSSVPSIVPRFHFDGWTQQDYMALASATTTHDAVQLEEDQLKEYGALSDTILSILTQWQFDGLVLEMGGVPIKYFPHFLRYLGDKLHAYPQRPNSRALQLIMVLPSSSAYSGRSGGGGASDKMTATGDELIKLFGKAVDKYSLMTYDYSTQAGRRGPNAPVHWIRSELQRLCPAINCSRILMGLNFYGYQFSQGQVDALVGSQFIKMLQKRKGFKLEWDEESKENYFSPDDSSLVFYPTPRSLAARLQLAKQFGASLSIWELGQGLKCFLDQI